MVRIGYLATAAAFATLVTGWNAVAESLEEAMVTAYLSNPKLQAARSALLATDELVPQALSGWRPRIFVDNRIDWVDVEGSGNRNSTNNPKETALTVRQPIYRGGQTVSSTRRAENLVRAERARLTSTEQLVLLDVVGAFTSVVRDERVLDLAISNENRLKRQLAATRDRFSVGEVTRTDVAQAEARVAGGVADRVQAEGNVISSKATYVQVVGEEPGKLIRPAPLDLLPASEAEAQNIADANPNIEFARFDLAAARDNVDVASSALLPTIDLNGDVSYVDDPADNVSWQRRASIGASIRIPLYQGGAEYSRVRETKQTVSQRRNDLNDTMRTTRERVSVAWETMETATARIVSFNQQVRANEIALEGVRQEALVGARTTLDVLDAEQELFESEIDFVRANRDQVVASFALKSTMGELTAVDLGLPVEPFDVHTPYESVRNRLFGLGEVGDDG